MCVEAQRRHSAALTPSPALQLAAGGTRPAFILECDTNFSLVALFSFLFFFFSRKHVKNQIALLAGGNGSVWRRI